MKRLTHIAITCFLLLGSRAFAQNRIVVDVKHPATAVSKSLYGLFFEEINHAGDGGLYAEMLRNRSFEEADPMAGWKLSTLSGKPLEPVIDTTTPLHPSNPHSLQLNIREGEIVFLDNVGYWGMNIQKGHHYHLSFYAKTQDNFDIRPHFTKQGAPPSAPYPLTYIKADKRGWTQYSYDVEAQEDVPNAQLRLDITPTFRTSNISRVLTFSLDMVSLFPTNTWKSRPNGLRYDLANKLNALKPAFIRFPGGCFVEGFNLKEAFRWKKTIGDLKTRPSHGNKNWDYHSTDGLGYHEYLQMCEDMKAEPLFVINCGMACAFRSNELVPLDQLGGWVQDALDAIEYANGDVRTRWGAVRAMNGHPKPFRLRYMEIGNENGWGNMLPHYEARYARFYDAIKAKYPNIQLIATTPVTVRPMDMIDEHFYNSPEWFFSNANRYDTYSRKGAKVYVGEYAVTQGCGLGNLIAGLGEAAWMLGMERNSDHVTMASYAPLFVNVNDRKWNPDAIGFDNANSYGTPSYYVQKLFGENLPDTNLPTKVTAEIKPMPAQAGTYGLGTWRTQAEYKGIETVVNFTGEGKAPDPKQFDGDWRVVHGDWQRIGETYRQNRQEDDMRSVMEIPAFHKLSDYTLRLKARKIAGAEGFLVMFRVKDDNNWYWWNIGGWGNTLHAIERSRDGGKSLVGKQVRGSIETGRWYDIRIELSGSHIRCYLDDKLIHDVVESDGERFFAQAGQRTQSGEVILKVVNATKDPQTTDVLLDGVWKVNPNAEMWVLTGNPNAENSLKEPNKVVPVRKPMNYAAPRFQHTFPPYSLTMLRFKVRAGQEG